MKRPQIIIIFLFWAIGVFAQHTLIYTNSDVMFLKGKDLYDCRKYAASYDCFQEFLQNAENTAAGQIQEAEFYIAANAFELRRDNAEKLLSEYAEKHPYTPFADRTNFMLGSLKFENKDYEGASLLFGKVDEKRLIAHQQPDFLFRKGYAFVELQEYRLALPIFFGLKNSDNRYRLSSAYYYAYCEYHNKNYAAALPEFLKIENNEQYKNIVPYYIIQIYYSQKKYDELTERAELLLKNNPKNRNNAEIYRIMGEISFEKRNFGKAIAYLKDYEELSPQVLRNDIYLLGLSYYETGLYPDAVKYLSKATTQPDEMSENAYLYLGNAYVKLGDKTNARLAYEAALNTNFNASVREKAMYNYALTTYETNTAFNEAILAFSNFLNEFPSSAYANRAKNYFASVLLTTTNYSVAYDALQKIKNPNEKLLNTRQYLLYQMGAEAFRLNDFASAIDYFSMALNISTTSQYAVESYFWRSESYFGAGENEKSIRDLKSFFANAGARNSVNFTKANYSMAYAYFSQKNYNEALVWFLRYVNDEKQHSQAAYPDALNRIGDCYFYTRNFEKADEFYRKATAINPGTGDYALFQTAYVSGLQKKYNEKITILNRLLSEYPNSEYAAGALYETGRAYVMLGNENRAIEVYRRLLEKYPNSDLARKAALETGMFYFNANNQTAAIAAYKNVISSYPGSEEAHTAFESLEQIYMENNDAAGFIAYAKPLDLKTASKTENYADSISYFAAERQYINARYDDAARALNDYLQKYCPGGRYCINARYYLADSYYRLNNKTKALDAFSELLQIKGNQHLTEATMRCAEITYDQKDFSNSLKYFTQLKTLAKTTADKNAATLGILRCSYFLNDHQTTTSIANEIISDKNSGTELVSEAKYNRAKAYIATNQLNNAIPDLKNLSTNTKTETGAEAKYLLAKIYFDQGKNKETEDEINNFAKQNSPQHYWLARSIVLLADVYIRQNNDFQAKQYLLSLQKNYTQQNDIQQMINTRLKEISERESKRVIQ